MERHRGFTLVELMVTIAIVAILLGLGLPSFQSYINNSKIRSTAKSFLSGIQQARSEAVSRNVNVDFVLTSATTLDVSSASDVLGRGWVIRTSDGVTFIEGKAAVEGGSGATNPVVVNDINNDGTANAGTVATITFTGLGTTTMAADTQLSFTNPSAGTCATDTTPAPLRCLQVNVGRGGQAKLCDPAVAAGATGDTRSCS